MTTYPGFESPDHLKRSLVGFDVSAKKFIVSRERKYYGGVPLFYDAESRRVYIDAEDTHSLVFGATGSLKTRSVVSPTIKVLGYAGESMIINDPKGELYSRHAAELEGMGYNIVEINFRNPSLGNAWNPLFIPYQFYISGDEDKAGEFINDIANNLMVSEKSSNDPFWDYSASDLLYGLILLLFRYCRDHKKDIDSVNIGNLINLRRKLFAGKQQAKNSILWKYASEDELAAASLSGSVYAPNDTMNSILSVFDQKMRTFTIQPTLLNMLANHDFDVAEIGNKPTCVFLITPDEKTSYHKLVSLFIKQSYEYLIYSATQNPGNKVNNRITYVVDEFSSLPKINDMPAMISAARSRDIRFLLVVQSKSSLKQRYAEEADTIIANCSNWIFFTSRELELLRELSELCGVQKNRMPNISVYDLQHFSKQKREALVLCDRNRPLKVNMIDIDMFADEKNHPDRRHKEIVRKERKILDFELMDEIKEKYRPKLSENPFRTFPEISGNPVGTHTEVPEKKTESPSFDVDQLLKDIDKKIEELEEEDRKKAEQKKNEQNAEQKNIEQAKNKEEVC